MARDKLTEYSATASDNTVCGDVNIAENSALPSDLNNFAREIMSHLKNFSDGTDAIDALTVTGDLTVDTNTLYVDSTNNNVGIGTTSPSTTLHVNGGVMLDGITVIGREQTTYDSAGAEVLIDAAAATPPLICHIGGSEKIRFQAAGGISFNGDTAAANALDDYEEGTFTPVISPGSGSFTTTSGAGYYTKIGNQVFVFGYMKIDNIGTGSGGLAFAGLPFASSNRSFPAGNRGGLLFIREDQRTGDTMHGFISGGQPYGSIQDHDGLGFSFTTNDTFFFDGVYHTG